MAKNSTKNVAANSVKFDENQLFTHIAEIIEARKSSAGAYANREITLMYWEIGRYIGSVLLGGERAEYGKRIVSSLATQLESMYGRAFELRNLRRMVQFAEKFGDFEIVSSLTTQLSWTHFVEILPLKSSDAQMYYAKEAAQRRLSARELRNQISRKAYERQEIANARLSVASTVPFNVFKDPYILDTLGLKENFLEADLEKAILTEIERFILEFGHGLTFVERQKRMIMGDDDFTLDLLFFHRVLRRLVAVELKIGKFKPQYMGQMRFYLKWLDRYERQEHENTPIGIILCTTANRDQIELMELDNEGIAIAEYWTNLPPKAELERKIREILHEARERLARRKKFPEGTSGKMVEYFYEGKDDDIDD